MEMDSLKFFVSDTWKEILIEMILEPSLGFASASLEKLLEKVCINQEAYYLTLYQAKITKNLHTIFQASERNNCFKNFSYIESLFLLKELQGVKESIKSSDKMWEEISIAYVKDPKYIKILLSISLNLSDKASEECLSIVNLILSCQNPSRVDELQEYISYL